MFVSYFWYTLFDTVIRMTGNGEEKNDNDRARNMLSDGNRCQIEYIDWIFNPFPDLLETGALIEGDSLLCFVCDKVDTLYGYPTWHIIFLVRRFLSPLISLVKKSVRIFWSRHIYGNNNETLLKDQSYIALRSIVAQDLQTIDKIECFEVINFESRELWSHLDPNKLDSFDSIWLDVELYPKFTYELRESSVHVVHLPEYSITGILPVIVAPPNHSHKPLETRRDSSTFQRTPSISIDFSRVTIENLYHLTIHFSIKLEELYYFVIY
jgi:hypothetical protein